MSPALHYRKNNSCGEEGRVESMRRAIQISILEMGIPCKPLAHGGTRWGWCNPMSIEDAIAEPHQIYSMQACVMNDEQRKSTMSHDLKVLTINFMRQVVKTPGFVHIGNLINFDGKWIKYSSSRSMIWRGREEYVICGFEVDAYDQEWEKMYPSLYGKDGWCREHLNENCLLYTSDAADE